MTHLIYPTTNFKAIEQLVIAKGEGVYVYDDQGRQYLEGMAGLWCTSLGYGNEELIEAAAAQMRELSYTHMFGGKTHPVAIKLADKLAGMLPMNDPLVFFGNSGSDANDTLIKLIHYHADAIGRPEKRKIISRERSYHGVTVASASLTGLPINQNHFGLPVEALGILRTDHPHYYRGHRDGESESQFVQRIVGNLEQLILAEGPETIAAFIAEPITGASGVLVPPAGYYEAVQAVLQRHGIAMWADEVITGFGRTGKPFGSQTMNIDSPALMTLAKQLSSAYLPISACAVERSFYEDMIDQSAASGVFGHGYTYSGHPTPCAVALKTLEIYERDNIFDRAASTGAYLQEQLAGFADHELVGEVRGSGLLAAVELVANRHTGEAFPNGAVGAFAQQACQNRGLIVRVVAGSSMAFCPPLIITREQVDEMMEKFSGALDDTLAFARGEGLLAA